MKRSVQVTIRGQQLSIRSTRSSAEIQQVADFVDERIAAVLASGTTLSTVDATVLAFLNVAGQYLDLQRRHDELQRITGRLNDLDDKLSAALNG